MSPPTNTGAAVMPKNRPRFVVLPPWVVVTPPTKYGMPSALMPVGKES